MPAASGADCTRSRRAIASLRSSQGRSAITGAGGGAGGAGVGAGVAIGVGADVGGAPVNHQAAPPITTSNSKPIPTNKGVREAPSCFAGSAISSRCGGATSGGGGAGMGCAAATGGGEGGSSGSRGITGSGGNSPSNTSISSGQKRLASNPVAGSKKTKGPGSRCRVSRGPITKTVSEPSWRISTGVSFSQPGSVFLPAPASHDGRDWQPHSLRG